MVNQTYGKKKSYIKVGTLSITIAISLVLSGCTPQRRAMLRLTAEKFHQQVIESITSVQEIYTLTNVPIENSLSRDLITQELLTKPGLNFNNINAVNEIITQDEEIEDSQSDLARELDNLTAEYDTALEIFQNLESIDYGSSQIVARTAQPARCLTVKMLILAKEIQNRPPKPNNPQRVRISLKLNELREQYKNPELSTGITREEIKRQVAEQVDAWLAVNAAEKQMIEASIAKLVIAADTGRKLSKLIDDYSNLSFDVIATRVTQIIGVTSTITGSNYSTTLTQIKTLEAAVNQDPTLRNFHLEVANKNTPSQPLANQLCQKI